MTDLHCHVLPRMDDGSASPEESIAMLRALYAQGIRTVVATPHFYADSDDPARFLKRRAESFSRLEEAMAGERALPAVKLGAEVHYFPGISESDALEALTLPGGRALLVEMPPAPWTEGMLRELENLRIRRRIIPVVAHVERYLQPWQEARLLDRLGELAVLTQANASFILSHRSAMGHLRRGRIHLLGSDSHNMHDRAPNLGPAMERIRRKLGDEALLDISRRASALLD